MQRIALIALIGFLASTASSRATDPSLTAIYYADSRNNNTLSLIYQSQALPGRLHFWGFTDFDSAQDGQHRQYDLTHFFSEARLTHPLRGHLSGQVEYNDATGADNGVWRLGLVYRLPVAPLVILRAFPLESDGDGGQLSAVWRWHLASTRLWFEGFIDYNFTANGRRIVAEPQLRYALSERADLALEYRRSEFIRSTERDPSGLALGLAWDF